MRRREHLTDDGIETLLAEVAAREAGEIDDEIVPTGSEARMIAADALWLQEVA